MEKREWQPIPLPVPDLPQEPPPDRYPKKDDSEIQDPNQDKQPTPDKNQDEPTAPKRGSVIIGGEEDDREWNPFKRDDEM